MNIFCPVCHRFVGEQDRCRHCAWARPPRVAPIGEVLWQVRLSEEDPLPGMPAFPVTLTTAHGLIFVPTEQGEVVALDIAGGEITWRRIVRPDGKLRTYRATPWRDWLLIGPQYVGERPEMGRSLLVWDAATGAEAWEWPTPAQNLSAPLVEADVAYLAASEPRVCALNLVQRAAAWTTPGVTWSPEPVGLSADVVVVPSRSAVATALRAADGERLWTFSADNLSDEWLHLQPLVMPDLTILSGWSKHVYAVDTQSGELRWRADVPRGVTCAPVLAGDRLER